MHTTPTSLDVIFFSCSKKQGSLRALFTFFVVVLYLFDCFIALIAHLRKKIFSLFVF